VSDSEIPDMAIDSSDNFSRQRVLTIEGVNGYSASGDVILREEDNGDIIN